ncbi:MAG: rhodanese-like domain-containing protein [Fibrobacterota bacterium]|nr:rhodanese-like domain-containing protein [Fibrobacterota bacterium]
MIMKKFYLKCLSHGSYFLADQESGEAAVIDPQRDTDLYEEMLKQGPYRLKYVLETHIHADFVSGHVDLASKNGSTIVFGAKARAKMPHQPVKDGDILRLGKNVEIKVLETPGHTPESVCYLVRDLSESGKPMKLFSGDTVFVGDVGRPDLLGSAMPADILASQMYDTLREKILTLPDDTEVYPAHGAGSACGRNLGDAEFTTLAEQKRSNYAMQPMTREEFITLITEDQPEAPAYFSEDARLNREGPERLENVLAAMKPMGSQELAEAMAGGAILLDTRGPDDYSRGSIPGAVEIGLDGQFANWVGSLVPKHNRLVLIAEPGREEEAAVRCARVGFDEVLGYLDGGFETWKREGRRVQSYLRAEPEEMRSAMDGPDAPTVLDIRSPRERGTEYIPGTLSVPLTQVREWEGGLAKDSPILVHCASGYRSGIAVSLLRKMGYTDVRDVTGGLRKYSDRGFALRRPKVGEVEIV